MKKLFITMGILVLATGSTAFAKGEKTAHTKKRAPSSVNCGRLNMTACQRNPNCEFYPGTKANAHPDMCLTKEKEPAACESLNMDACNSNPNCEFYPGTVANDRPDMCLSKE